MEIVDYGTWDVKCPSCKTIYKSVEMKTPYRPWYSLCSGCGCLITPEHRIENDEN